MRGGFNMGSNGIYEYMDVKRENIVAIDNDIRKKERR